MSRIKDSSSSFINSFDFSRYDPLKVDFENNIQITSNTTFTVPPNTKVIKFTAVGGGGAGVGTTGGAGAGYFEKTFYAPFTGLTTSFQLTIGAANGGNTVLANSAGTTIATAYGAVAIGDGFPVGVGGTAEGGDINSKGSPGGVFPGSGGASGSKFGDGQYNSTYAGRWVYFRESLVNNNIVNLFTTQNIITNSPGNTNLFTTGYFGGAGPNGSNSTPTSPSGAGGPAAFGGNGGSGGTGSSPVPGSFVSGGPGGNGGFGGSGGPGGPGSGPNGVGGVGGGGSGGNGGFGGSGGPGGWGGVGSAGSPPNGPGGTGGPGGPGGPGGFGGGGAGGGDGGRGGTGGSPNGPGGRGGNGGSGGPGGFGAGGGGGGAGGAGGNPFNTSGVGAVGSNGTSGNGGPGAIIIEWTTKEPNKIGV